ncbi:hypothetical protein F2Q69_00044177 [Brassica cretica]|uniref:Aspartic peptidase DDI1-type domain-containing protein n=1 Tax=Brassica cretica TaxID=69181 RepID=A0A8S9NGQ2_BRACR|nr:hypothetical protein F2Q69_00044177 [Brassica cretica]
MPSSPRSSKEKYLLFSDPARLERTIRKEKCITSINPIISSSIETMHERATIDTSTRVLIDTNPRADNMVTTLVLIRDGNVDLHDPDSHLCNAAGQKIDAYGDATEKDEIHINETSFKVHKELNGKFEALATHIMRLNTQVFENAKDLKIQETLVKWNTEESERNQVSRRLKKTLKKEQDLGKFLIPCCMHGHDLPYALCDIGSAVSIMAKDIAELLGLKVEPS